MSRKISNLLNKTDEVINFMGGISYKLNPINTLRIVTASSIFGEPQYYRTGLETKDNKFRIDSQFKKYILKELLCYENQNTSFIMESVIQNALDYDFLETLKFAKELRDFYNMRLNPQVIMVLASVHPKRVDFNKNNPGVFKEYQKDILKRADEPATQFAYYLYHNGKKNNLPNILKNTWKEKLESLSRYEIAKYKNHAVGIIDVVRVAHANNEYINELMTTGKIEVEEQGLTWENLRSKGLKWQEILSKIKIGHMALLRNLRGIFSEDITLDEANKVIKILKAGVINGKQFPFRYYNAYKAIKDSSINFKQNVLDCLEECIDISMTNLPKLKGKTICLSDNSGSAWGTFNSEYGKVTVADIGNLSSLITAYNSDEGMVGVFGDKLDILSVSKRNGILNQLKEVTKKGSNVGESTEHGIWLFFIDAINNKIHYDNIFIYSDMQAGHSDLYGLEGIDKKYLTNRDYINIPKLIDVYRKEVNSRVNIFMVQTAGYDNVVIPEYSYRTNVLSGWTGKEILFADQIIKEWDLIEK